MCVYIHVCCMLCMYDVKHCVFALTVTGSLAISQLYYDDTDLVGVFYATLPWRQLLSHLTPSLTKRRSSYLFVVGPDRSVLYHPLLPDSRLVRLMVTDVESEGVIGDVLDMVDRYECGCVGQ